MKNFIYFGAIEGGIRAIEDIHTPKNLSNIYGWMNKMYKDEDLELAKWMRTALVGQKYNHRLGYLVRLMDTKKDLKNGHQGGYQK